MEVNGKMKKMKLRRQGGKDYLDLLENFSLGLPRKLHRKEMTWRHELTQTTHLRSQHNTLSKEGLMAVAQITSAQFPSNLHK